jgi:hypothetical protein
MHIIVYNQVLQSNQYYIYSDQKKQQTDL